MPLMKFDTTPSSMNSNAVSLVLILIKLVFKLGSFDSSGWIAKHQAAHGKNGAFFKAVIDSNNALAAAVSLYIHYSTSNAIWL